MIGRKEIAEAARYADATAEEIGDLGTDDRSQTTTRSQEELTPMQSATYEEALTVFRDLCEDTVAEGFANEYVRGGVNLIADLFGVVDVDTGTRMDDVLADLRRIPMFAHGADLSKYGVAPYEHDPRR